MIELETVGIFVGVVSGLSGLILSVLNLFREKKRDARDAERDRRDVERDTRDVERDKKQDIKDRLNFLSQIFLDKDIPKKNREPAFDEFVRLGGNGIMARLWLEEGKKEGALE